jgi:hypothetical protein
MNTLNTLKSFALACTNKSSDEIYDLFEFDVSNSLSDTIYNSVAHINTDEPVRTALNAIGIAYNVQSLINY